MNVQTDGDMAPLLARGEALYNTRFGQLDMSCGHCHAAPGSDVAGSEAQPGQANGFPEYRLGGGGSPACNSA